MVVFMNAVSRNIPLPVPIAGLTFLSIMFSSATLILSALTLQQGINSSWFDITISVITLLFHGSILVTILLAVRRKPYQAASRVEEGLFDIAAIERSLYKTRTVMAWLTIIFAMWLAAVGATLYELLLTSTVITSLDKANITTINGSALAIAALGIYAFVEKTSVNAEENEEPEKPRLKPFTLTLPNRIRGSFKHSHTKDTISSPHTPPANLPEKVAPLFVAPSTASTNSNPSPSKTYSPVPSPPFAGSTKTPSPAPSPPFTPPKAAAKPEPRFNSVRTLVLVDPRMEAKVTYHGTASASP